MEFANSGANQMNANIRGRPTSSLGFLCFCGFLALVKLALISTNEIISIQDDSAVYANQAIGVWTLGYPQGYPIWLRLCKIFEVPQRIAIEALYLSAVVVLGYAVRKALDLRSGYLVVGLLAFAPFTYFLFDLGLSDGFYVCLTLLSMGVSTRLLFADTHTELLMSSASLGALLGTMAITRNEDPLLFLWILSIVGVSAFTVHRESKSRSQWQFWKTPVLVGVVISVNACLIVYSLCFSYYFSDGVFARGVALMPGHYKLLKNLSQIDTGQPQLPNVPISKRSRELAYAVSPTLAKLRSAVESPDDGWQVISRQNGIPAGEIGGGWIWHTFNTKLIPLSKGPAFAEAEYRKMNMELDTAFRSGKLKKRFIVHPLIGGNLLGLIYDLPPSASAVLSAAWSDPLDDPADQNFSVSSFDKAFVRRSALSKRSEVTVEGWAFVNSPGQKIEKVIIGSTTIPSAPVAIENRPDVVSGFSKQSGWKPEVFGFRATFTASSSDHLTITYSLANGGEVQAQNLKENQVSDLRSVDLPDRDVIQGIDLAGPSALASGSTWQHDLQLKIIQLFHTLGSPWLTVIIIAFAFAFSGYSQLSKQAYKWKSAFVFLGLGIVFWMARILLYSVLNARAWNGAQIRYLAPAHALNLAMLSVSIAIISRLTIANVKITRVRRSSKQVL